MRLSGPGAGQRAQHLPQHVPEPRAAAAPKLRMGSHSARPCRCDGARSGRSPISRSTLPVRRGRGRRPSGRYSGLAIAVATMALRRSSSDEPLAAMGARGAAHHRPDRAAEGEGRHRDRDDRAQLCADAGDLRPHHADAARRHNLRKPGRHHPAEQLLDIVRREYRASIVTLIGRPTRGRRRGRD